MKKNFWLKVIFFLSICCSISCQPGGGDFVPILREGATVESYNDKKDVVQVYDDEQVLLKMHGYWDVRFGGSYFFIEVTNKSQKDLMIESNAGRFITNLDEKIIANEIFYTVRQIPPGAMEGNQKPKEAKPENGKIKITSGQKVELETGFYFEIKEFSKSKSYFLGKEARVDIPIKFEGQGEKVYKFAFKYGNYQ